jgi:glycosyltransferase involved in cell wall biosynthesis
MSTVHQLVPNFDYGDAIGNHVRALRRLLRSWGWTSEVYAQYTHEKLLHDALFFTKYRDVAAPDHTVLFHFSIGSDVTPFFVSLPGHKVVVYHNITPPEYFVGVNARVADRCRRGRAELLRLVEATDLALGVSEFNRQELEAAGFRRTGVLPILMDWENYGSPPIPAIENACASGTTLLHVGRVAPNKRIEDLIKTYYFYHRLDPESRLMIVGSSVDTENYQAACRKLAHDLGLADRVRFTGSVSQAELCSYYRASTLYLTLSEHEGFCVPLLEAMHFGLPVVARASTGIPGTMGHAGVLVTDKDHPTIAELIHEIVREPTLRDAVVAGQRERLKAFDAAVIGGHLRHYLSELGP